MKSRSFTVSVLFVVVFAFASLGVNGSEQSSEDYKGQVTSSERKEGCRVWKDSLGLWNVCWSGSGLGAIAGQIWSEGNLMPGSWDSSLVALRMPQPNVIRFEARTSDSLAGFWFTSSAARFDIDVRFDGKRSPEKVYFGEHGVSPTRLPIRVEDDVRPAGLDRSGEARPESVVVIRRIGGARGVEDSRKAEVRASELKQSLSEVPPGTTSDSSSKRSGSAALRLPDDLRRGWPPVTPPIPRQKKPDGLAPDDSAQTITEVYDVATGKIRRLDEDKAE